MSNKIKMDKLLELFKMLRVILVSEGDGNWIRGVDSIIFSLSPKSISTSSDEEAIRYAESTYKAMFRGMVVPPFFIYGGMILKRGYMRMKS